MKIKKDTQEPAIFHNKQRKKGGKTSEKLTASYFKENIGIFLHSSLN